MRINRWIAAAWIVFGLLAAASEASAQRRLISCASPAGTGYVEKEDRRLRSVIVFVHGLGGDAVGTWTHKPWLGANTFWPCALRADPAFADSNLYVHGYPANLLGETGNIDTFARALHRQLVADQVLDHAHITFVTHSLGGLVVSRLIEQWRSATPTPDTDRIDRVRQVLFFGVPGLGADLAVLLKHVAGSELVTDLADLAGLKRSSNQWAAVPWPFMRVCLAETLDTSPIWSAFGDRVVTQDSAFALCSPPRAVRQPIVDHDHLTIVKPDGPGHPSWGLLHDHYAICVRPLLRDLRGLDLSGTAPGLVVTGWAQNLIRRMTEPASADFDRRSWMATEAVSVREGWSTNVYVSPLLGRQGLRESDYELLRSAGDLVNAFDAQLRPRAERIKVDAIVPLARLQDYLTDRHAITLRDDLLRQGVAAQDDLVVALNAANGDRMLLFVSPPPQVRLRGFLLVAPRDDCARLGASG